MQPGKQNPQLKTFPPVLRNGDGLAIDYLDELDRFETPTTRRLTVLAIVFFFGLLPLVMSDQILHFFTLVCIYAIVAVGLQIMTGYSGQLSLGHGALFGVGTYTGYVLAAKAGLPFFLVVPLSGVVATAAGTILAIPSLRLRPIYMPMATLAGQFIVEYILRHWESLTGGAQGLVTPGSTFWGWHLDTPLSIFYMTAAFLLLTAWLADNLLRSKIGRALLAIRQNGRAAAALGIAVYHHKLLAFAVSSFFAGLAGALFAYTAKTITPNFFNLTLSIEFLAVILIGGLGSINGSLAGAAAVVFLNRILAFLGGWMANSDAFGGSAMTMTPLNEIALGFIIVIFVILKPKGLSSIFRNITQQFQRWPFS